MNGIIIDFFYMYFTPGERLNMMQEHIGVVRCLTLHGNKLITGGDRKKIVVWDAKVSLIFHSYFFLFLSFVLSLFSLSSIPSFLFLLFIPSFLLSDRRIILSNCTRLEGHLTSIQLN